MSLDTKWLEDFLQLAEMQHFSRAAEARHITQPAFGRHIRALEKAVGQTLVNRSTTPISLTPAGRQFRTIARNIVSQMEDGLKLLNGIEKPLLNPIRIATPHSLSSPTLLDLIHHLEESEVSAQFSVDILRVDYAVQSLSEGDCDFLLGFEILSLLQPPFKNLCLGQGDFLLVSVSDSQGKAKFSPQTESVPILRYSSESYSARLIEQKQPELTTLNTYPVFESSMCQLHKEMALRGKGIAWLPDTLIQQELTNGQLIAIDPEQYRIPYQIRLYRNGSPLHNDAETVWVTLKEQLFTHWQLTTPWATP